MNWFTELTGIREESPEQVRSQMTCEGTRLKSNQNQKSWNVGRFELVPLGELKRRVPRRNHKTPNRVSEIVADVQHLHADRENSGALFQVASQFNLLEMVDPRVEPEDGVGLYEYDATQGPACAIAAGASTIYRNYFVPLDSRLGQSRDRQINGFANVEKALKSRSPWDFQNGYVLPTLEQLHEANEVLRTSNAALIGDHLEVGIHWDTDVTLEGAQHKVHQIYCSAMPVAYSQVATNSWESIARLVLESAYLATMAAAIENLQTTGNNRVFLTLLGGGAFGNPLHWIVEAIENALSHYADQGLDIRLVSFGRSNPALASLLTADSIGGHCHDI